MLCADATNPYDLRGPFDQLHPCCKRCNILESKDRSLVADFDMREQHLSTTAGQGMALKKFFPFLFLILSIVLHISLPPLGVNKSHSSLASVDLTPWGGPRINTGYVITRDDLILLTRGHRCFKLLTMLDKGYLIPTSIIITNLERVFYFDNRKWSSPFGDNL